MSLIKIVNFIYGQQICYNDHENLVNSANKCEVKTFVFIGNYSTNFFCGQTKKHFCDIFPLTAKSLIFSSSSVAALKELLFMLSDSKSNKFLC